MTNTHLLSDGRALAFAEWGDPSGVPVIHFHGIPGSRLERYAEDSIYERLGIRYVTVDRPGYGRSDPRPGRTFTDWASDVSELADAIGLARFSILGVSGGCPFALATAHELPRRIDRIAIVSGVGPSDRSGAFAGMDVLERMTYWASPRYPWLTALGTRAFMGAAAGAARVGARAAALRVPVPLVKNPATLGRVADILSESMRQGARATVDENILCARPWGFSPSAVATPVTLWHGDKDGTVPLHHAEHLASVLPNSRLEVRAGGHFMIMRYIEEILRALVEQSAI
jgi:pimeloyl-ACP methyl ester carboxylesterase